MNRRSFFAAVAGALATLVFGAPTFPGLCIVDVPNAHFHAEWLRRCEAGRTGKLDEYMGYVRLSDGELARSTDGTGFFSTITGN